MYHKKIAPFTEPNLEHLVMGDREGMSEKPPLTLMDSCPKCQWAWSLDAGWSLKYECEYRVGRNTSSTYEYIIGTCRVCGYPHRFAPLDAPK